MSKISIITTTYHHEQFIADTIESVLAQSFADWELLIGDDSPDDATWGIIQRFIKKYPDKIRAWHHAPNKGIVGNMNFLLGQVSPSSEYISFLEGDDMYLSHKLEACLNIFEMQPTVGLVYTNFLYVDSIASPESQRIGYTSLPLPNLETNISNAQFFHNFYYGVYPNIFSYSTGMVRRDVLDTFGGKIPDTLHSANSVISDFDFYYRIMRHTCIYGIMEPLLYYRSHSSNISKQSSVIVSDLEKLFSQYESLGLISRVEYQKAQSRIALMYSSWAIMSNKTRESLSYILRSFRYFPHCLYVLSIRNTIATLLPLWFVKKIIKS